MGRRGPGLDIEDQTRYTNRANVTRMRPNRDLCITNITRGTQLAARARVAAGFWERLVGLLGRRSLAPGEGLVITPCRSVHTLFMRFTIDVVYVDRSTTVVKTVPKLKPFRTSGAERAAHSAIELPSGTISDTQTIAGDRLAFSQ